MTETLERGPATTLAEQPLRQRLTPPMLVAGGLLAASVALHVRDPHQQGSWGFCPWLVLTGTYCPGCGGLRAVNDLTNGDVRAAFASNALFVALVPAIAVMWIRSVTQRARGRLTQMSSRWVTFYAATSLVLIFAFWVVRNLPFADFLRP